MFQESCYRCFQHIFLMTFAKALLRSFPVSPYIFLRKVSSSIIFFQPHPLKTSFRHLGCFEYHLIVYRLENGRFDYKKFPWKKGLFSLFACFWDASFAEAPLFGRLTPLPLSRCSCCCCSNFCMSFLDRLEISIFPLLVGNFNYYCFRSPFKSLNVVFSLWCLGRFL